jgi:hypothetical protein
LTSNTDIGPVDIVYTWVNGDDSEYLKKYNRYAETPQDFNPERIRDVYQIMKYSLRSIEKYVPWLRNICIITARPQVPEWLNISHPRVKIIHHDEIIDEPYLPTFNYNVIESFQHKIDGLSEFFISMNDDFLFGNDVFPSDFMDSKQRMAVFNTIMGENFKFRIYEQKTNLFNMGKIEHNPVFYKKSYVEELLERHKEEVHKTRSSKFRRDDNITMQKIFRKHVLSHHRNKSKPIWFLDLIKIHRFHKITNDLQYQKKKIESLKKLRPKYYCLNDDQRDNPNPDVIRLIKDFLDEMYPNKSAFEN